MFTVVIKKLILVNEKILSLFLKILEQIQITIEQARDKQEQFNKYLKQARIRNKSKKQRKHQLILICVLMEEILLSNL